MTREQIFAAIKANVLKVLPDVNPQAVAIGTNLTELGANSVDRVEVAMYSMESLQLKIPLVELHGTRNLADLVDLFFARIHAK